MYLATVIYKTALVKATFQHLVTQQNRIKLAENYDKGAKNIRENNKFKTMR